jgi:hypothetical protein
MIDITSKALVLALVFVIMILRESRLVSTVFVTKFNRTTDG